LYYKYEKQNKSHPDQEIILNKSNDQTSFNSAQEQSKQSNNEAIDKSKRIIDRNLNEAQNQIPCMHGKLLIRKSKLCSQTTRFVKTF
jgi:hypothetical protein